MRLYYIKWDCDEQRIKRLESVMDMCCVKYVIFKEYDFVDGTHHYKIYFDKGNLTKEQLQTEINRVKATKLYTAPKDESMQRIHGTIRVCVQC